MVGKRRGRHTQNRLDAKRVASLIRKGTAGKFFDGAGLLLLVKTGGGASWVLRVTANGKRRDLGLGGADIVSLAKARETAREWRATVKGGGDPLEARRKARTVPTFEQVARGVHVSHYGSWRNAKHRAQWLTTLQRHVFPELGSLRVDLVGVPEVLRVLQPLWLTKPETARRVRQRIRTVLDVARAAGHRSTENAVGPVLARALPKQTVKPEHHPAMPYADVPAFFARLDEPAAGGEGSRCALRLLILTACRTGEVLGCHRSEIDLAARVWTIPGARMKMGIDHRIPLSEPAASIIKRALDLSADSDLLFPGMKRGKPLSNMALLMLCRRLGVEVVPHGFRSSFRDWAGEQTSFPPQVAELALAHAVGGKTERAYARSDLFAKRRKLMDAWASYVTKGANVVAINRKAR